MDHGKFVEAFERFFFPPLADDLYTCLRETNEIEADSDGSQMLEKFQSKHLNFEFFCGCLSQTFMCFVS